MDVTLRNTAGSMTQQRRNGQFGISQSASDAGECMPKHMRRNVGQLWPYLLRYWMRKLWAPFVPTETPNPLSSYPHKKI